MGQGFSLLISRSHGQGHRRSRCETRVSYSYNAINGRILLRSRCSCFFLGGGCKVVLWCKVVFCFFRWRMFGLFCFSVCVGVLSFVFGIFVYCFCRCPFVNLLMVVCVWIVWRFFFNCFVCCFSFVFLRGYFLLCVCVSPCRDGYR
jgi:hypothetical protein